MAFGRYARRGRADLGQVRRRSASSRKTIELRLESLEDRLVPSGTYFVSPAGNDANDGLAPERPWRTISRVNNHLHTPGDTFFFEGGALFNGSLSIHRGDPANPITVSSYGAGRATIASGTSRGIWVCSAGGLYVLNLNFVGAGADANNLSGIELCNARNNASNYVIADVDVSGYGLAGIAVVSDVYGMRDILITRATVHDNANGIHIGNGEHPSYRVIENLWISYTEVYNNDRTTPGMAGIGIGLGNVSGAVIERNLLHDNGPRSWDIGHAGLLVNDSSYLLVQHNEAYRNNDPNGMDGQGFAFNGVTDSVIHYNYAHDNRNAGFVLMGDDPCYPTMNNTLRYNVSENDGVGISIFHTVWNAEVYNNTVYVSPDWQVDFRVAASVTEWSGGGVHFRNNIFLTVGGCAMVMTDESSLADGNDLRFENNGYFSVDGEFEVFVIYGADAFFTLAEWRFWTWQEWLYVPLGYTDDPRLVSPGQGGTVGDPDLLHTLSAYQLRDTSPFHVAALDLLDLFGIHPGGWDFYGTTLPQSWEFSLGAHQFSLAPDQGEPDSEAASRQAAVALALGFWEERDAASMLWRAEHVRRGTYRP